MSTEPGQSQAGRLRPLRGYSIDRCRWNLEPLRPRGIESRHHQDPQRHGSAAASAWIATAFAQDDAAAACKQWREVADQARPRVPKLAKLMDGAEADVLAYMGFPAQHRAKIHSTNPIERLNGEIKRRSDVPRVGLCPPEGRLGIFPNEAAINRLIGALLLEQNDEWAVQRARYRTLETIAPLSDDLTVSLPSPAA